MIQSGELFQALNSKGKNLQSNTQVITLTDNLSHPYFTIIDVSKNNSYPIGSVVLEAPYTPYISNYWIKYEGVVVISFELVSLKQTNTNSSQFLQSHELKQRINNEQYNYSFIGRVGQFKQKGNKFIIHIEDVGWKFLQKVPKDFRETYIANQPLGQAFQAICEFLGVDFAYSIEDLNEYTFGADGYSVTKDGQTIEDVETILSKWQTETQEETDELDDPINEDQELIDLDKQNKDNKNYVKNEKQDQKIQSNDNTDLQQQLDKHQEDFDQKILDLFIGNSYYESDVDSNVLNYDKITVTPKAADTSSDMNSVSMDSNGDGTVSEEEAKKYGQNLLNNAKGNVALTGLNYNVPKKSLSYAEVNALTFLQAREEAKKTNVYYWTTILRLRARAALYNVGPNTPYSKFNY